MQLLTALVLALGSASAASAGIGDAWLDGYGPLDKDVGLPAESLQHSGSYSARWTDEHLLTPYIRRQHVRDFIAQRASDGQIYPPEGCKVTLVNSLQRHGARYPTPHLLKEQKKINQRLADALKDIPDDKLDDPKLGKVLRDLPTVAGYGDLVPYGALQGYYSGLFDREVYKHLLDKKPYSRGSGNYGNQSVVPSDRDLYTGRWWLQAFTGKDFPKGTIDTSDKVRHITDLPELDVVISEFSGTNNTLDPLTCPKYSDFSSDATATYADNTLRDVVGARIQRRLKPAKIDLSANDVQAILSQCSFITLGTANVTDGDLKLDVHPICNAFEPQEWRILDYYYTLSFYYGTAGGNPYYRAASQGYLRELYAVLNDSPLPLDPITTTNTTTGFPLPNNGDILFYASFTHDSNIMPTSQAFGLFPSPLLPVHKHAEKVYKGPVSASKIVPYQTKHIWEKISCEGKDTDYLRVRVNQAVHPIVDSWCPVNERDQGYDQDLVKKGLCPLPVALKNLKWVNGPGEWPTCF